MFVRREFVASMLSDLSRCKSFVELPRELEMDAFHYRTQGEKD